MNKNQYKNDSLFVYFEDEFCISTIKISELYFPAGFFRYRKKSEEQLKWELDQINPSKNKENNIKMTKEYLKNKERKMKLLKKSFI